MNKFGSDIENDIQLFRQRSYFESMYRMFRNLWRIHFIDRQEMLNNEKSLFKHMVHFILFPRWSFEE